MMFDSTKLGEWHQLLLSKLHLVFLIIFGPITVAFCFLTPPLQPNDEWAHFERAVEFSYGEPLGTMQPGADCGGFYVPESVYQFVRSPGLQPAFYMNSLDKKPDLSKKGLPSLQWGQRNIFEKCPFVVYPPSSYIAPAVGLTLSRWAHFNLLESFYIGRLFSTAFGLLLSVLAIKCIDTGKLFAFSVLCAPEARFLGGSFSHDSSVTAYAALAVGLHCLWRIKRETTPSSHPFQEREIGVLIGTMILVAFVVAGRPPDFPLVFVAALWIWIQIKEERHARELAAAFAGLALLYPAVWILFAHHLGPKNEFGSDSARQVHFMLHSPGLLPGIFFHTVLSNCHSYVMTFVGIMGSSAQYLPSWCNGLCLTVFLLCFGHEAFYSPRHAPFWLIGTGLVLLSLIFVVLNVYAYIFWTPVGGPMVIGVGGRYFFPLLLFACLLLGFRRIPWKAGWIALAILVFSVVGLTITNLTALYTVLLDYYFFR